MGQAYPRGLRFAPSVTSAIPLRIFCSDFSPNPFSLRSWPASATRLRSSTLATPSWRQSRLAVFGPTPGIDITFERPDGTLSLSLSRASTRPSRRYWSTFSAIAWPTPGIPRSAATPPFRQRSSMSSGRASISRAARR